jgi:hypothetical protein
VDVLIGLGREFVDEQGAVDDVGEPSFEAAQRFAAALAFGLLAGEECASGRMHASLGDRDSG